MDTKRKRRYIACTGTQGAGLKDNQQGAMTMTTAAATTEYAVLNVNSRELLSDWVSTRDEAERIADECEQHETQPEVKVIERNTVVIVCGKTIQIDRSGVGHNWQNLPAADLTDDLADVLTAEILDSPKHYGRVNVGGVHYRWQ